MSQSILKKLATSKPLLVIEFCLVALLGFYFGKEMLAENATQQEIGRLEAEMQQLEHSKNELSTLLEYVQTDEFVASEARAKLNLVSAGEQLVVIPDVDATPEETALAQTEKMVVQEDSGKVLGTSNAKLWWHYFFDRTNLPAE